MRENANVNFSSTIRFSFCKNEFSAGRDLGMSQEERVVGFSVERHRLDRIAAAGRADDESLSPGKLNVDTRVGATVHDVKVLSGNREEAELQEHV